MTRFEARPGLDEAVAVRVALPAVRRVASDVRDRAQRNAPDGKVWVCVAPETRVTGGGVTHVARRTESRDLIRLTLGSPRGSSDTAETHDILTVTPNHEVLTSRGWLSAQEVKVGDDALGCAPFRHEGVVAPDEEDRPPTIAEVFHAASLRGPVERVMGVLLDLDSEHGALGLDRYVDVVAVDGELRDELDAHARKVLPEWMLGRSDLDLASLLGAGLGAHGFIGPTPATLGGALREDRQGLLAIPLPAQDVGLRQGARRDPPLGQDAPDRRLAGLEASGEHADRLPPEVLAHEVLAVDVVPSLCHVYDLSTEVGWYVADGMIVHNCAHDERVRPSHNKADGQVVPTNLRFLVPKVNTGNDVNDVRAGFDQAVAPRDPNLPVGNKINCRCVAPVLRGVIARAIHLDDAHAYGTRASARVSVTFPRIGESEHPSEPDRGGGWFLTAVREAVAALPRR